MSLLDDADLMGDADLLTHVPNTATHKEVEGIWYPKHAEYRLPKLPEDDDELWLWMQAIWGMRIPRTRVCEHHSTPFEAFADAYFARNPVAIWKASRGFGGKSRLLASLVLQEACFLPAQVTILGGSGAQSLIVHAHTVESWSMPHAPKHLMTEDPTKYDTRLANGAWIRSLMASQSSVRGPHPQRLRLDEIDEMELEILEASQGQPMRGRIGPQKGIETQTVMSSTHQYPDKCVHGMTNVATARGSVHAQDMVPGDMVMTRDGWRAVESVVMTGYRPVVNVYLSNGRTLTCTEDHRIALPDGGWSVPEWLSPGDEVLGVLTHDIVVQPQVGPGLLPESLPAAAGLLPGAEPLTGLAHTAAPPVDPSVLGAVGMPLGAGRLGGVASGGGFTPQDVLPLRDDLQVAGVHTRSVPAEVIDLPPLRDGANERQVGETMCATVERLAMDPAVPLRQGTVPHPAPVVVDGAPVLEPVRVESISHTSRILVPVYDLQVSGTHEFLAEGVLVHNTMTAMLKRASENGWPIYEWCWRESANPVDGWLTHDEVERKRNEIAAHMWETEYDLQEPSFEGRAIDSEAVNACFDPALGVTDAYEWESLTHQTPRHPRYVTGVDWAKQKDRTVIATFDARGDDEWECVAWQALTRTPWPHMVGQAERRLRKYPPVFGHDATGLGNVVSDFFDPTLVSRYKGNFRDVLMASGRARHDMFTEYVSAIESGKIRYPRIDLAYREHLYCGLEDLYGKGHPPDSVVAGAIAWSLRGTGRRIVAAPQSMGGRTSPWSI